MDLFPYHRSALAVLKPRPSAWAKRWSVLAAISLVVVGCTLPETAKRRDVADEVTTRSGLATVPEPPATPAGAITEESAVNLALYQNAFFQEQLAELELTRADVIQAGLIANPDLLVLFPVGPKQGEGTLTAPLDSLWLREKRLSAAKALSDRTAARLVQAGMDLVRDVRLAYSDWVLVRQRLKLLEEATVLQDRVARIAEARLRAGDATPLDSSIARAGALRARAESDRLAHDVAAAEERLRALLGLGQDRTPIEPVAVTPRDANVRPVEELVAQALSDRPEARSAALAVGAAEKRSRLVRGEWLVFSGVADANTRGAKGFEAGPGMRLTLPVFNQNQGAVARADAELERSRRQQATLRDRIILEIREAHARLVQAGQDVHSWGEQIVPALEQAADLSERAYRSGETPLVQVLDAARQLNDARLRQVQAAADLRRAQAELERAVGRRLDLKPDLAPRPTTTSTEDRP